MKRFMAYSIVSIVERVRNPEARKMTAPQDVDGSPASRKARTTAI